MVVTLRSDHREDNPPLLGSEAGKSIVASPDTFHFAHEQTEWATMNGQPNFGMLPNATVDLRFIQNEWSWKPANRERLVIDLTSFPSDQNGAYVIRFRELVFPRLVGESSVLKVGEASVSFLSRFKAYTRTASRTHEAAYL